MRRFALNSQVNRWFALAITVILTGVIAATPATVNASRRITATAPLGLFQVNKTPQNDALGANEPAYAIQYYNWNYGLDTTDLQATVNAGITPFVELQPCFTTTKNCDTAVAVSDILGGKYDSYLTLVGNQLAGLNHPVLLTFAHEMNGNWYPWGLNGSGGWTPTQWIQTWHYVTSKINSLAPNVKFVWAPNREDCTSSSCAGVAGFDQYWPGLLYPDSKHVDYLGLDAYYANSGSNWSNVVAVSLADEKSLANKPWMFTETGVNQNDSNYISQINDLVNGTNSVRAGGYSSQALVYFDPSGSVYQFTQVGQTEFCVDMHLLAC